METKKKVFKKKKPVCPMVISGACLKSLELIGVRTIEWNGAEIVKTELKSLNDRVMPDWPKEVYLVDRMFKRESTKVLGSSTKIDNGRKVGEEQIEKTTYKAVAPLGKL